MDTEVAGGAFAHLLLDHGVLAGLGALACFALIAVRGIFAGSRKTVRSR